MSLIAILVLVALILALSYILTCYIFAQLTLNPKRQPIATTPSEYGMDYEDVEFQSRDGLTLKGWFIPGDPRRIILFTHPMYCNRHGFLVREKSIFMATQTDIELLLSLKALHDQGYSILCFDFRNHGESQAGLTGVGLNEYQDVLGAVDFLQEHKGLDGADLGLVAYCMGANAAIIALSKDPHSFARARCLAAVQPISMNVFVRSYVQSTYTRLGLIVLPLTDWIRQRLGGYSLAEMTPGPYVQDLTLPTLYVQGRQDDWTDLGDIRGFYDKTTAPKGFKWIETSRCRPEAYQQLGLHPEPLVDFVNAHMGEQEAGTGSL
jgi:pimeloyl-ACP methyl ester carboxylesterase